MTEDLSFGTWLRQRRRALDLSRQYLADLAERAAQLFAWTNAMREMMGDPRPPVEQASIERDLAIIHAKLTEAEFENSSAEGSTITTEQAIALALEEM